MTKEELLAAILVAGKGDEETKCFVEVEIIANKFNDAIPPHSHISAVVVACAMLVSFAVKDAKGGEEAGLQSFCDLVRLMNRAVAKSKKEAAKE